MATDPDSVANDWVVWARDKEIQYQGWYIVATIPGSYSRKRAENECKREAPDHLEWHVTKLHGAVA